MRLLRVQVPEYRGLKDIDISFEQDLMPQVFPIGGENGSGKSTLLQMIFVLLHHPYHRFPPPRSSLPIYEFELKSGLPLRHTLRHMKANGQYWRVARNDIATIEVDVKNERGTIEFFVISEEELDDYLIDFDKNALQTLNNHVRLQIGANEYCNFLFFAYHPDISAESLEYVRSKIFLAGQSTQPYIFLSDEKIQELFKPEGEYEKVLADARAVLPNFYNYNQSIIMEILETFKAARDSDFKEAIESGGRYGNAFNTLLEALKQVLGSDKYIFPTLELDAISVRHKTESGEFIELSPGSLSHGELKRISLYCWIKRRQINNAVVLLDEIENGLHPDWQYNIVRDLGEWGDKQNIMGTHSFYLCEALTPRHVKELEPALRHPPEISAEKVD